MRQLGVPPRSVPYRATDAGLFYRLRVGKRVQHVQLTNFVARIVADVEEDDGAKPRRTLEIEATLHGRTVRFAVPAARFRSMDWALERLGATAVLFPGAKAHGAAAVQTVSGSVATEKVHQHTGWTEIAGQPVYVHAGGGIGEGGPVAGVRVDLPGPLTLFRLPAPPGGPELRRAVRASLRLLDAAPDQVTVPPYGAVWRVVLGTADFAVHLVGPSGSGKTVFLALVQQHWGPELDAQHLPATWLSTANANEELAFTAKDAILGLDDFVRAAGGSGGAQKDREADQIFRGQGNSAGRGRLRSGATLQSPRPPRGLILSTGEGTPRGPSVRARLFILAVGPDMVDFERITACQQDAAQGLYAAAMAGYVRWLAPRLEEVRRAMPARLAALREQATASGQHKRTPGIVANLAFGLELFSEFAVDAQAMTAKQAEAFRERCWQALGEAAAAQAVFQAHGEPAQRFLSLLGAASAGGKAHIAAADGQPPADPARFGWHRDKAQWVPGGRLVGWLDGEDLYLEPEAAYDVAQQVGRDRHEPLGVGDKALHKRLHDQGLLASVDQSRGRLVVRRTLQGEGRVVLHLRAEALPGPAPAAKGPARRRPRKQ